jgi:hypothetical protein
MLTGAREDTSAIGLAKNAEGVAFRCGTCEYFDRGVCHNPNPKLDRREVGAYWCCNLYDHKGMKVVV